MTPTQLTDSRSPEVNGDMTTIWIPLTTAYPCHTSCSSLFWRLDKEDSPIVAWDPGYELWVDPSASCQPAAVSSWWHAEDRDEDIVQTRWSLGPLVCPEAYTTATTSDAGAGSTLVGCCPSGYTFITFVGPNRLGQCISDVRPNQVLTWAEPVSAMSGAWEYTSFAPQLSTVDGMHINGWVFNAVDTAAATGTPTGGDGQNADQEAGSSSSRSGWTSTTKMAVAVGVPLGVLALAGLALALFFYRRRGKAATTETETTDDQVASLPAPSVSPLETQGRVESSSPNEVASVEKPIEVLSEERRTEVASEERPIEMVTDDMSEMPAPHVVAELPARM
ncbi:hypothetical protein HYQ45_017923 [Verticillium longisporum]|uniref:Uncharacterized protein n=1 Tax=Verticillium longisporum TaxID=100787 RepID=A0A8I2Z276_VERLO|nr:hypothetical protein HYQ45_017923 [Verticillium longisporum]KAG7110393.1 hypothetical protein HYQ44_010783 [Verticillium longisporum]